MEVWGLRDSGSNKKDCASPPIPLGTPTPLALFGCDQINFAICSVAQMRGSEFRYQSFRHTCHCEQWAETIRGW